MAKPTRSDSDRTQYWDLVGRVERLERGANQEPTWYDVVFNTNWRSLDGYPVQVARVRAGVGVLRGIATRFGSAFVFGATSAEMFSLPSGMQLYDGGSGSQVTAMWGQDGAATKSMYRVIQRASDNVFYVDQVLTGASANGGVNSWISLGGCTFALRES